MKPNSRLLGVLAVLACTALVGESRTHGSPPDPGGAPSAPKPMVHPHRSGAEKAGGKKVTGLIHSPAKAMPTCVRAQYEKLAEKRAALVKLYGLGPAFDAAYGDEKAKLVSREALTAAKCSPDGS